MTEAIERIDKLYLKRKRESNSLDFDDLMTECLALLAENETVRRAYQRQFQFVLVDEFQDTNAVQSELIDIFAGEHGNLMVVGDDAQSIYSWRGADFQSILTFPDRHKGTDVYKIETNYRSVPEILEVANQVIERNTMQFRKDLTAARDSAGVLPARIELNDVRTQARFVIEQIQDSMLKGSTSKTWPSYTGPIFSRWNFSST